MGNACISGAEREKRIMLKKGLKRPSSSRNFKIPEHKDRELMSSTKSDAPATTHVTKKIKFNDRKSMDVSMISTCRITDVTVDVLEDDFDECNSPMLPTEYDLDEIER